MKATRIVKMKEQGRILPRELSPFLSVLIRNSEMLPPLFLGRTKWQASECQLKNAPLGTVALRFFRQEQNASQVAILSAKKKVNDVDLYYCAMLLDWFSNPVRLYVWKRSRQTFFLKEKGQWISV